LRISHEASQHCRSRCSRSRDRRAQAKVRVTSASISTRRHSRQQLQRRRRPIRLPRPELHLPGLLWLRLRWFLRLLPQRPARRRLRRPRERPARQQRHAAQLPVGRASRQALLAPFKPTPDLLRPGNHQGPIQHHPHQQVRLRPLRRRRLHPPEAHRLPCPGGRIRLPDHHQQRDVGGGNTSTSPQPTRSASAPASSSASRPSAFAFGGAWPPAGSLSSGPENSRYKKLLTLAFHFYMLIGALITPRKRNTNETAIHSSCSHHCPCICHCPRTVGVYVTVDGQQFNQMGVNVNPTTGGQVDRPILIGPVYGVYYDVTRLPYIGKLKTGPSF